MCGFDVGCHIMGWLSGIGSMALGWLYAVDWFWLICGMLLGAAVGWRGVIIILSVGIILLLNDKRKAAPADDIWPDPDNPLPVTKPKRKRKTLLDTLRDMRGR